MIRELKDKIFPEIYIESTDKQVTEMHSGEVLGKIVDSTVEGALDIILNSGTEVFYTPKKFDEE